MFGSVLFLGPNEKRLLALHDAQERRPCYKSDLGGAPTASRSVCLRCLDRTRVQRSKGVGGFVRVDTADRLFGFARVIASAFFFAARERVIGFFMVCVFSGSHTFTKSDRAKTNAASI